MVINKPTLLLYCQHSLGMGHLVRSFSLTRVLTQYFQVVFLNGGPIPDKLPVPQDIEMINLPALGMDDTSQLISKDSQYTVEQAKTVRKQTIMDALTHYQPSVILIELYPFGRKKFADELIPLLEQAQQMGAQRPAIFCSLRDILVDRQQKQQVHDDRAAGVLNQYFDAVLVHSDPRFAQLSESFRPSQDIQAEIFYSGFVSTNCDAQTTTVPASTNSVLVSAGGGIVGMPLFSAAVIAQPLLWLNHQLEMTIVAGPFLPAEDWQELQEMSENVPGLTLIHAVSDLRALMQQHDYSVSQCGYNTVMDLLVTNSKALLVPFSQGIEDEQSNRARRLQKLGVMKLLEADQLSPESLEQAIIQLQHFSPNTSTLDIDGAENTAQYITSWIEGNSSNRLTSTTRVNMS